MVVQVRRLLLKRAPPPDVAAAAHELAAAHCRQYCRQRCRRAPDLLRVTLAVFGCETEAGIRPHMTLVYRAGPVPRLPVPRPFTWRAAEI